MIYFYQTNCYDFHVVSEEHSKVSDSFILTSIITRQNDNKINYADNTRRKWGSLIFFTVDSIR